MCETKPQKNALRDSIPGCSLGMAITLGRECGKSVGAYLG